MLWDRVLEHRFPWSFGGRGVGAMATAVNIGNFIVHRTSLWFRKVFGRVSVSLSCRARRWRSHIVIFSMHADFVSCLYVVNVGVVGPVHLSKGRDTI